MSASDRRDDLIDAVDAQLHSRREARWLVEAVVGSDETPASIDKLEAAVARRLSGEPLQYVIGEWDFRTLSVLVDPRVLIPRPETEELVDLCLEALSARRGALACPRVVDLGTGSGVIATALALEAAPVQVLATDADPSALAVAAANVARHGVDVELHLGSWWSAVPIDWHGSVDLVVSNPPYVAADELDGLDPSVRDYEPRHALVAADTARGPAMADIEVILQGALEFLAPHATVALECSPRQVAPTRALAQELGLRAEVIADMAGKDRFVVARRP